MPLTLGEIEVREVDLSFLSEIVRLRDSVWADQLGYACSGKSSLEDKFDSTSRHWAGFHKGRIVASARLGVGEWHELMLGRLIVDRGQPAAWPCAELMRLVVERPYRSLGLAKTLDLLRLEAARAANVLHVYGLTTTRPAMLAKQGFEEMARSEFMDHYGYYPSAEAFLMRLSLSTAGDR